MSAQLIEIYNEILMIWIKCLHNPQAFYIILNHQWVSKNWQIKWPKLMFLKYPVSVWFPLQGLTKKSFFQLFFPNQSGSRDNSHDHMS